MEDMFGYGEETLNNESSPKIEEKIEDLAGSPKEDVNGNPITELEDVDVKSEEKADDKGEQTEDSELTPGTQIEVDGKTYSVDNEGNIIDENNNIFKEAKDVKEWLKSVEVDETDDEKEINIQNIIKAVDIEIVDDNDKPIEFENTPDGIKAYLDAVIETSKTEIEETAIQTLFSKYPVLQDVLTYYVANGNNLDGFNEVKDRSGIQIDEKNEAQQEHIIRTAWTEQGRKGNVDQYIQYLKSTGALLAIAQEELEGLQEADKAYQQEMKEKALEVEKEKEAKLVEYWNGIKETIDNRSIAGYKIPETINVNRNGQKLSLTPNDFFNYLYRVDSNGYSQYQKDLMNTKAENRRDEELLRAYLKFTGGSYSDLVKMAVNQEKVKSLKIRSKESAAKSTVRITKPTVAKTTGKEIDFGY